MYIALNETDKTQLLTVDDDKLTYVLDTSDSTIHKVCVEDMIDLILNTKVVNADTNQNGWIINESLNFDNARYLLKKLTLADNLNKIVYDYTNSWKSLGRNEKNLIIKILNYENRSYDNIIDIIRILSNNNIVNNFYYFTLIEKGFLLKNDSINRVTLTRSLEYIGNKALARYLAYCKRDEDVTQILKPNYKYLGVSKQYIFILADDKIYKCDLVDYLRPYNKAYLTQWYMLFDDNTTNQVEIASLYK